MEVTDRTDSDPHFHTSLIFVGKVGSILMEGFKHYTWVEVTDSDTRFCHFNPSLIFVGKADSTLRVGYKHWIGWK